MGLENSSDCGGQMLSYRSYSIETAVVRGKWRCIASPSRPDLPILWRYALFYDTEREAVVDAKRRVDEILAA